jgi:hypothetical protein
MMRRYEVKKMSGLALPLSLCEGISAYIKTYENNGHAPFSVTDALIELAERGLEAWNREVEMEEYVKRRPATYPLDSFEAVTK